ncbi:hypothetical protein BKA56DRAFT_682731 [Ilyonectria sp. MPI-CAGE-AT-0026]|nr:hypothetical protein BKA56DRAFT_682731 [Ilyonectria sp. MPI-CAGE-AT-0026]
MFPYSASAARKPRYENQKEILDQYVRIWNGDLSLEMATFNADAKMHIDRLFTGNETVYLPINSSKAIIDFVQLARQGWSKYEFIVLWTAGSEGQNLALRWMLNAVIGPDFNPIETTLKEGAPISFNGTDFFHFDECTGLIKQIEIAQDSII